MSLVATWSTAEDHLHISHRSSGARDMKVSGIRAPMMLREEDRDGTLATE